MTPVTILLFPTASQAKDFRYPLFLPAHESFILQYFLSYGPGYQLDIPPSQRQDMNTPEDLANVLNTVTGKHTYTFWLYFILPFFLDKIIKDHLKSEYCLSLL